MHPGEMPSYDFRFNSMADLVRAHQAGICIEPENEEQLIEALVSLKQDRVAAARMGVAAKTHIASAYDYNKLVHEYSSVLERVTKERE